VAVAAVASAVVPAFSVAAPKRVLIQHLHEQGPGGGVTSAKLAVAGSDVISVEQAFDFSGYKRLPSSYRDWQVGRHRRSRPGLSANSRASQLRWDRGCVGLLYGLIEAW
jgi:hypothetical protein